MPGNNVIDSELPNVFSIAYGIIHAYWRTLRSMLPCSSVDLGGTSVDIMVNQALVMQVAQYRFRNMSDLSHALCFQNDTQLCVFFFFYHQWANLKQTKHSYFPLVTVLSLLMRGGRCRHKTFKVAPFHKTSGVNPTQDAASATLCEPLGNGRNLY